MRPGEAVPEGLGGLLHVPVVHEVNLGGGTTMRLTLIPPGTFLMGGDGQSDNPQHRVTISKGFWMGIYPVTQAQWQAVTGNNPSNFPPTGRPKWFLGKIPRGSARR